jgi:hypothetical protein
MVCLDLPAGKYDSDAAERTGITTTAFGNVRSNLTSIGIVGNFHDRRPIYMKEFMAT